MNNKDQNNACYQLDFFEFDGQNYPALSEKNRDFIEAILSIDSNYRYHISNENHKHIFGKREDSIIEAFNELKSNKNDFYRTIHKIMMFIDSSNSTHIQSAENALEIMCERLKKANINNIDDLRKKLNIDYNKNKNHLFNILNKPLTIIKTNYLRFNTSFVSKFLSYCYQHLIMQNNNENNKFSKYDNVVCNNLPIYFDYYVNGVKKRTSKSNKYILSAVQKKQATKENKVAEAYAEIYSNYNNDIQKIIDKLKEQNINLTRDEVDHIIWYTLKSKKEKNKNRKE